MNSTQGQQSQIAPADIKLQREDGSLTVVWKDGHVSRYDLPMLRLRCPCATCNAERQKKSESAELLPILKSDPGDGPPQAIGAKLVGNYALQILWADGHNTGIYDFRYLRDLENGSGTGDMGGTGDTGDAGDVSDSPK